MDDREILYRCQWHFDTRSALKGWRKRREKRERKMPYSISKLGALRPVPGVDGIEPFQVRDAGAIHDAEQIQASIRNGSRAVGEADQRQHRTRGPNLRVIGAGSLQRRQRENYITDRARPNEQAAVSA